MLVTVFCPSLTVLFGEAGLFLSLTFLFRSLCDALVCGLLSVSSQALLDGVEDLLLKVAVSDCADMFTDKIINSRAQLIFHRKLMWPLS